MTINLLRQKSTLLSIPVLLLVSGAASASPVRAYPEVADGVYRLQTARPPSPVLVIEDGEVIRAAGSLKDPGCVMREKGAIEQEISLERLFSEVENTRRQENALLSPSYHSAEWQGENPFGYSKVDLAVNQSAGLELTHTVATYLVNENGWGMTLCNRHHRYQTMRLN